jgi:hypothetical protein
MNECKDCKKAFECFISDSDPCKRVMKYEKMDDKYYIKDYKAKGLGMNLFWSREK